MNKNDAKLIGEAIAEGVLNKFERELAGNTESASCSEAHEAAMLEIIATSKAIEQRIGRKRFVAILVAAALLLLVGCTAYVYRNQIGSFIETFLEDGVNIGFADKGENKTTTIEEVYELTYVPDEYVLTQKLINDIGVVYTYTDENQNSICYTSIFSQVCLRKQKSLLFQRLQNRYAQQRTQKASTQNIFRDFRSRLMQSLNHCLL